MMRLMLQKGAIWELIALFLTNQIAGNTSDFKMNVINSFILFSSETRVPTPTRARRTMTDLPTNR